MCIYQCLHFYFHKGSHLGTKASFTLVQNSTNLNISLCGYLIFKKRSHSNIIRARTEAVGQVTTQEQLSFGEAKTTGRRREIFLRSNNYIRLLLLINFELLSPWLFSLLSPFSLHILLTYFSLLRTLSCLHCLLSYFNIVYWILFDYDNKPFSWESLLWPFFIILSIRFRFSKTQKTSVPSQPVF